MSITHLSFEMVQLYMAHLIQTSPLLKTLWQPRSSEPVCERLTTGSPVWPSCTAPVLFKHMKDHLRYKHMKDRHERYCVNNTHTRHNAVHWSTSLQPGKTNKYINNIHFKDWTHFILKDNNNNEKYNNMQCKILQ